MLNQLSQDLAAARASRWWLNKPKIARIDRAAAFIDDLGFALLFPREGLPLPSLWVAGSDPDFAGTESWGPDAVRMWGWKDEIPRRELAWYGHFIRGRKSFLSRALLTALYPRSGRLDDYRDAELSTPARAIADIIRASGPTSAAALREAIDMRGKRWTSAFTGAIAELGRGLVITHYGVEDQGGSWPSAMYELTVRAFKVKPTGDRIGAARTFLDTVLAAKPLDLARAFGWSSLEARGALDACAASGAATRDGSLYLIASKRPRRRR